MNVSVRPFGESALLVELGDRIDESLLARCRAVANAWEALGHGTAVPAYASIVLRFDPLQLDLARAGSEARRIALATAAAAAELGRLIEIPTHYDGPDLADTAARSATSAEELVAMHSAREYVVFFLGFLPGFAYCGPLDTRIIAPRLERPRERVPAGAVAIADGQTAVYPLDSPGGWRLIGRTELALFDPLRDPPATLRPGDRVRFVAR
jgi:KipI family sensor histidine kinase inhibitor